MGDSEKETTSASCVSVLLSWESSWSQQPWPFHKLQKILSSRRSRRSNLNNTENQKCPPRRHSQVLSKATSFKKLSDSFTKQSCSKHMPKDIPCVLRLQ